MASTYRPHSIILHCIWHYRLPWVPHGAWISKINIFVWLFFSYGIIRGSTASSRISSKLNIMLHVLKKERRLFLWYLDYTRKERRGPQQDKYLLELISMRKLPLKSTQALIAWGSKAGGPKWIQEGLAIKLWSGESCSQCCSMSPSPTVLITSTRPYLIVAKGKMKMNHLL